MSQKLKVKVVINKDLASVWDYLTSPNHIKQWTFASDDWHSPFAENDLREGGRFKTRMEAKDGSVGFDFEGVYTYVEPFKAYTYKLEDDRVIDVTLNEVVGAVEVTEVFDPETENPLEMQQEGWQSILDNFKAYCER